jgi:hypothetical protein
MASRLAATRTLVLIGWLVAVASACGGSTSVPPSMTEPTTLQPSPSEAATSADPGEAIEAVMRGEWRRVPVDPRGDATGRVDATCRAAEPRLSGLPVALIDSRGQGHLLLVYATDPESPAFECLADVDATTAAAVSVTALQEAGEPIADEAIDIVRYAVLDPDGTPRVVLVGRTGRAAVYVVADLNDETYVYGTRGGGWYAMWWPGAVAMLSVASLDTHHLVLGSAHGEPERR